MTSIRLSESLIKVYECWENHLKKSIENTTLPVSLLLRVIWTIPAQNGKLSTRTNFLINQPTVPRRHGIVQLRRFPARQPDGWHSSLKGYREEIE